MKLNNNDDSHNSGLNLLIYNMLLDIESHPAWVCGLKHRNICISLSKITVTPCVGVWIETPNGKGKTIYKKSHPAWVCGLKHFLISCRSLIFVTPCVGVWIETLGNHPVKCFYKSHPAWVCGLKPIWRRMYHGYWVSHPAWVCGLKRSTSSHINATELSHPAWVCGLKQIGRA